jgi:hypothetical protein
MAGLACCHSGMQPGDMQQQFRVKKNRGGNIDIVRGEKKDKKRFFWIILV